MRWLRRSLGALVLIFTGWTSLLYFGIAFPTDPVDRPIKAVQPKPLLRIAFVGTSLTASYEWPKNLSDCAGRSISTWRIARAGATSGWGIKQAGAIIAKHPDVIFIEFSINDADLRRRVSLRESARNHGQLVHSLKIGLPEVQIVLMTMSPAHGLRRLLRPRLPAYYRLYRDLAEELGTGLLDLYPRWLSVSKPTREQQDGLHPSEIAAARTILSALRSYLGITC